MNKVRVLLVDDSEQFLQSATAFLSQCPSVEVIGTATSGKDAIKKVQELRPDLVLMDIAMPRVNGLVATKEIKNARPETKVIIVSIHKEQAYFTAAKEAGSDGYVVKDDLTKTLLPMIRRVCSQLQVK